MIVICTKCHAKFRMADERVGPRGAKVRCSKCQAVFVVAPHEPEAQRPPPLPPPLPARPAPERDAPLASAADPFASAAVADPFAPAEDPFAPRAAADPFRAGAFTPLPPASADPFAAAADPFASAGTADPFDARGGTPDGFAAGPHDGGGRLPVTDLADLLGPATPPAFSAPHAGFAPAGASLPAPVPTALDGLALEDRTTPAPAPLLRGSDGGGAAIDMFAQPEPAFDAASFDFGGAADDALTLAGEPERGPVPAAGFGPYELGAPARDEEPPPPPPREARAIAAPGARDGASSVDAAPAPGGGRVPGARGSRLRAAAVNAIALAALLLAALAILVVWRADGPLDASALGSLSVARALRTAAPGPFAAQEVRSGLYEREKGPPFLFVRGDVVSRAPAPVAAVQVDVEVVREGRVIARGEAIAGAVPTPEELHRAPDAAALAALARAAAARAPSEVRPGDVVPFLVAIGDHPADLSGASLRIALAGAKAAVR
jgi:predicted Zn finger-like uncharacterized protein